MQSLASPRRRALIVATTAFAAVAALALAVAPAVGARAGRAASKRAVPASAPFITGLHKIATLSSAVPIRGPAKGDQNPYGVAVVANRMGKLVRGSVLVSNFNNSMNQQGTGSSIVEISPHGSLRNFAVVPRPTSTPAVGLTTALVYLKRGFVIVGSLPAPGGNSANASAGALSVLNAQGKAVSTIKAPDINGPWDMTAVDHGIFTTLYVTNVLNGTLAASPDPTVPGRVVHGGTVVRIELLTIPGVRPIVLDEDVIGTGFAERTDPGALVVGPTGVALERDGTLYVADTQNSRIAAIPDAPFRFFPVTGGGFTVSRGHKLNGPLGMTLAPNGDILTANAGDGNIVETTPFGAQTDIGADTTGGAGALFGLTVPPGFDGIYFVDDADNTLRVLAP
jgi:hypothetical protein